MKRRSIQKLVRGRPTVDGAGVRLTRVLDRGTVYEFDPFLMLDSFDSRDPEDYIRGFPLHPHRGIETLTMLLDGEMAHMDTLGNKGRIGPGQCQWMTAGSGIRHEEMPVASPRLRGLQLWLNLPRAEKMAEPRYFDIGEGQIGVCEKDGATVRVISGAFEGAQGVKPRHIQATVLDVSLRAGRTIAIPTKPEETVFIFLIEGAAMVEGQPVPEKTAVLFGEGEEIAVSATQEEPVHFFFFSGRPLGEPVAWGGPIVMNTQEELRQAFNELEDGTFIKHGAAR